MFMTIQWLMLVCAVPVLSFLRASMLPWMTAIFTILLIPLAFMQPISYTNGIVLLISVFAFLIFAIPSIRRRTITCHLVHWFKQVLPTISDTEQAALDAGDTWWEAKLMQGLPQWQDLLNQKTHPLTTEEKNYLDNEVVELCRTLDGWQIYTNQDLTAQTWALLKQKKFFGLVIPKTYGGLGFSALAHSTIVARVAAVDLSAAVTVMVPNSLGPAELLLHYGSEEQKQYYLPRLADGTEIPCFGLTGTHAGSDAGAMTDIGIVKKGIHEGKEIVGISLTFDKRYITLAPIATVIGLAFKLEDPDHLLSENTHRGITLCLLPGDHPGIQRGKRHLPAGSSFMNGPIKGENVFIPLDWIIGGKACIGEGWRMLMECLATGRGISLPALATAYAERAYLVAGAYAKIRRQFGVSIGDFEGIQAPLASIGGHNYMIQACRLMTVSAIDDGYNPAVCTAISKYYMTEFARLCAINTMDICAGKAIIDGPSNTAFHAYQSVPIAITVEGANILTRNLMIFGQGAVRCHPYVLTEIQAVSSQDTIKVFDKAFFHHVGYAVNNAVHTTLLGITQGWYRSTPTYQAPEMAYYYRQLSRMSSALAFVTDMTLLILGGDLKRKEALSARLADVLGYLYLGSAVLRYFEHNGRTACDKLHADYALDTCLHAIQSAFFDFFRNFPQRLLARTMQFVVFPYGRSYHPPTDELTKQLANAMMSLGECQSRMTSNLQLDYPEDNQLVIMHQIMHAMAATKDIQQRVQRAVKQKRIDKSADNQVLYASARDAEVIDTAEYQQLIALHAMCSKIIHVDAFDEAYFKRNNEICPPNESNQVA